jgi:hypothetical protein
MKKIILISIVLINVLSILCAAGVGTTGANYLKIGLGAKAAAMGENFTGLADDVSAIYWNAAGLTKATSSEVDFMQLSWVAGISAKTFLGVYPISDTDFIGGYMFMMDTPYDKETRIGSDNNGDNLYYDETTEKFKSSISVVQAVYSKKVTNAVSVGLGLKSISEDLAGNKATGVAADVGLLYADIFPNLSLGASIQNIGVSKLRSDEDLPMTTALGLAYATKIFENKLNIVADGKFPNDNDARYGIGAEYWLGGILAGRIGYNTFSKISLGMGLQISNLVADYAYVPLGDLGITHRISVGYKFDVQDFIRPEVVSKTAVIPTEPSSTASVTAPVEVEATQSVPVTQETTTTANLMEKFDF